MSHPETTEHPVFDAILARRTAHSFRTDPSPEDGSPSDCGSSLALPFCLNA